MTDDSDFWALVYAAAISGGSSNFAAMDIADRAIIDRKFRWNGEKETSDQG